MHIQTNYLNIKNLYSQQRNKYFRCQLQFNRRLHISQQKQKHTNNPSLVLPTEERHATNRNMILKTNIEETHQYFNHIYIW